MTTEVYSAGRTQAIPYLTGYVAQGLTGAGALSALREQGLGYRTQDFYTDWRRTVGYAQGTSAIRRLMEDDLVPDNLMTAGPVWQRRAYNYETTTSLQDPLTGEWELGHLTLSSDIPLSVGEIEAKATALYEEDPESYGAMVGTSQLVGVHRRVE